MFVPGALGSYFVSRVERFGSVNDKYQAARAALNAYLIVGFAGALALAAASPWMLTAYGVVGRPDAILIVVLFQTAAAIASANAALTQFCVSVAAFGVLAASAIVWILVLSVLLYALSHASVAAPVALIGAYAVSFAFAYWRCARLVR